jgi:hypothetical protein
MLHVHTRPTPPPSAPPVPLQAEHDGLVLDKHRADAELAALRQRLASPAPALAAAAAASVMECSAGLAMQVGWAG